MNGSIFVHRKPQNVNPRPGYIYSVTCRGFCKFGIARNITDRVSSMQTGNPFPLKFAGFITADGIVTLPGADLEKTPPPPKVEEKNDADGMQSHTLYLDKTKTKKFTVSAPLELTQAEIKRIQKWLEVTLLVDWNEPTDQTQ